ncbi:MAG TPA: PilC/PilY family type IV pilus protein, partial [Rhodanobacteraceae bacterium]|nr:PilC/PilY family type IV pilus protein [Rhodanobacteraceae bacterium]
NAGDSYVGSHGGKANQCLHQVLTEHGLDKTYYDATDGGPQCPAGTNYSSSDHLCHYPPVAPTPPTPPTNPTPNYKWVCPSGGSPVPANAPAPPSPAPECLGQVGSRVWIWAFTYVVGTPIQANAYFVVPNGAGAPSDGWCAHLYPGSAPNVWNGYHMDNCVDAGATFKDASGKTFLAQDGTTLSVGQNIANWFSYYRTRMLMAKTGLMVAFSDMDQSYRFGFASINANGVSNIPSSPTPYGFDDSTYQFGGLVGGSASNQLATVQPFGLGSDLNSQRSKFWKWIANESAANGTPLRKALKAVGEYYKTDQPWTTMPGDPGYTATSTTKFACRASYTILTTDGFWNGDDPTTPSGIVGAASQNGPVQTVPTGDVTQYLAQPPFTGGGAVAADWNGNPTSTTVASLADVATYYWENDLQTGPDWPNEVAPSKADPASWQHMTTFTVGLGFTPPTGTQPDGSNGIMPAGTTIPQVFGWAHAVDGGASPNPTDPAFSWPTPYSNSLNNIADLAHAAVNGHGDFFNVTNPQALANAFKKALADIAARTTATPAAAVNASVLSLGALSFSTGYETSDWSGSLAGVTLKTDGTVDTKLWSAGTKLDAAYHSATGFGSRTVYTDAYNVSGGTGTFSAFQFNSTPTDVAQLDAVETAALQTPALAGSFDTLAHRIDYLLGDNSNEGLTQYRPRTTILGAIIRSDPVYVAGATGNYYDSWPAIPGSPPTPAPETGHPFGTFVTQQSTQPGMVYIGANDGMLHAFRAPVPNCTGTVDSSGNCSAYSYPSGADPGSEVFAFVPRAVYANLGNLTLADNFHFRPTVDATPVRRDVFFSETVGGSSHAEWHTILAGGVGIGGRGVYALDVTDPSSFSAADVLWEFDSDMTPDSACVATYGSCRGTDLGYTVSQPNISRLHNGLWAVLVPNGYFPDCTTPDTPTNDLVNCQAIAADAPQDSSGKPYSALFVMDAQTGKMIAELKTPTDISGVTSFGLATPVMGDYNSDQVDDVAFAGDVQGNLWRFDLSSSNPSNWTVTLVYKGLADTSGNQGLQPITTMPRLFPDPVTNRFMVVFGTGKLLGVGDNGTTTPQSLIAVRDVSGTTYSQPDLTQQYLHETVVPSGQPNAGATLRCVTGSADDTSCAELDPNNPSSPHATAVKEVPASSGGWFINLYTTTSDGTQNDAGERVVVNPGAIFASNTVIFETLITGTQSSDVCNPQTQGSILALDATGGAPAGVSSLGGGQIAGARINNARTSGSLPVVSALGGGQAYLPGATLAPANTTPMSIDAPMWRRRSWQEINQDQ